MTGYYNIINMEFETQQAREEKEKREEKLLSSAMSARARYNKLQADYEDL